MAKIDSLFKMMKKRGASDLHISTGAPPLFRLHGEMEKFNYPPLNHQQARGLLFEILKEEQSAKSDATLDLDFAYSLEGVECFRCNLLETHLGARHKSVICQQFLRTAEGKGLAAALEILTCNSALANLIREAKTFQIPSIMQTAKGVACN